MSDFAISIGFVDWNNFLVNNAHFSMGSFGCLQPFSLLFEGQEFIQRNFSHQSSNNLLH